RSQLGLLEQAHALGHEVCVVDGSPDAPLLADADHRIVRSFADVGGVLADLEAEGIEPVAIATMGSDQAVLPTAQLADRLGLSGLSLHTAHAVSDKRRMREAFEADGVPCAAGREADDLDGLTRAWEELGPPLVVKPVDGSAQRGVTRVDSRGELVTGFDGVTAAVKGALGTLTRDDLLTRSPPVAPHGQVRFVVAPPGRIVRLDPSPVLALDGVHEAGFYWPEGGVLPPLRSGAERL